MQIDSHDALIVVDVQNDFIPGGSLAVKDGGQVVPVINRILPCFSLVIMTRDWHPADHISFSQRPAFTDKSWPPHCVQNTRGAEFHPDLRTDRTARVVSKGTAADREEYSGFQARETALADFLRQRGIRRVFISGLTTEYCVKATALDGLKEGFEVFVILDAIRPVDVPEGSGEQAVQEMKKQAVHFITSQELPC